MAGCEALAGRAGVGRPPATGHQRPRRRRRAAGPRRRQRPCRRGRAARCRPERYWPDDNLALTNKRSLFTSMEEGCEREKSRIQIRFLPYFTPQYTVTKSVAIFPSPAGMSLTKFSLEENNLIIPGARESLVNDIPAGEGIIANLFLQCR